MTAENFVRLALGALVAVVLALAAYRSGNQWSQGVVTGARLAPALASGRTQVAGIAVRQGDAALTLQARDGRWGIEERAGYPADVEKVRALLVKLAQAELIEAKTRKADRYALLELEDPKAKDARSRSLKVTDAKGGAIAELVVGKKRWDAFGSGKGGTYVRIGTDPQTWLASAEIDAPADVRSWIRPGVLEIDAARIATLTIEIPGEEPLKIERPEGADAKAAFAGLPGDRKLKDAGAAEAVLRAAASIEADDVRKLASAPAGEGVSVVRLETRDGLDAVLRLRKDGEAWWVSIAASGRNEAGTKAATVIKARAEGWELKIPATKAEALLKRRAELLQSS